MSKIDKREVDIECLKFDKLNPRLPKQLQGVEEESIIIDYMLKSGNILELMKSIAETGYFEAEPLLVVSDSEENRFVVVEGNRRLTALKLLNDPSLAKIRVQSITEIINEANEIPKQIPVIVYPSRGDILDYLGYRHITGVKDWGALEKARYLDQLYQMHCNHDNKINIYSKLAKMIGSRSDYVRTLHRALKLYNKANDEAYYGADITEDQISFSWITTAIGYSEISHFINLDDSMSNINEANFKKLFLWMFDPKNKVIGDSREISKLANIVSQEKALEKLEKGSSVDEAVLYTSMPSDAFMEMLTYAKKYLKQAKDVIEQLSDEPNGAREILDEISKIVKTINGGLDTNFSKDEKNIIESLSEEQLSGLIEMLKESKKR